MFTMFRRPGKLTGLQKEEEWAGYLFILPWLIGFGVFVIGPMIASFFISLLKADMLTPSKFVGVSNYAQAIHDPLFWKSLVNTCYYTFATVFIGIGAGLGFALALNQRIKAINFFRTIYYLPSVVSVVALSFVWAWLLNPEIGFVNSVLGQLGLPEPRWLFSETWAMPSLIIMSIWFVGPNVVIYLAAIQGVPDYLYDAIAIEGAGAFKKFRYITFPMITPAILLTLIMNTIWSFQVFTQAYLMTDGGPNNATLTSILYLYRQAFQYFHMGYASALAWLLFVVILAITLIFFKSSSIWVFYEAEIKK